MTAKTIYKKLAEAREKVGAMQKTGFNEMQKYSYFSDDQISETFRKTFNEVWIVFIYSSEITWTREISATGKGTRQFITDVLVKYSFVDIETGDEVSGTACWSWNDTGDKWVYKAITGAIKYIYMKTFQISTGDDPEKDEVKERKAKETEKKGIIDKTIDEIFPDKPIFDETAFNGFKWSVEAWNYKLNANSLQEIKNKYEVSSEREQKIKEFINNK